VSGYYGDDEDERRVKPDEDDRFSGWPLDERNAQHAKDFAGCTKEETLALHRKGAAKAASLVRGFSDEQLEKRGVLFTDAPPMTVEQLIMGALINHTDEHYGSIRKTVGK